MKQIDRVPKKGKVFSCKQSIKARKEEKKSYLFHKQAINNNGLNNTTKYVTGIILYISPLFLRNKKRPPSH